MLNSGRIVFWLTLLVFLVPFLSLRARADQHEIESALKNDLNEKIVILRGFYVGPHLQFDKDGNPSGRISKGYWSSDGFFQVSKVSFDKKGRLLIRGKRILDKFDLETCRFVNYRTDRDIELEINADPSWQDVAPFRLLLDRILLRAVDGLKSLVPDYWQPWMGEIAQLKGMDGTPRCAPADVVLPAPLSAASASPEEERIYHASDDANLSPPKALSMPDPKYPIEASKAQMQGTTVLSVVVNKRGEPTKIGVWRPFGAGLDDSAVEAVRNWKFSPAKKDGMPVAVLVNVEVNFRLP